MKTDDDLRRYLKLADGDIREAFRIACKEHGYSDQTLEMKRVRMEQMLKEVG